MTSHCAASETPTVNPVKGCACGPSRSCDWAHTRLRCRDSNAVPGSYGVLMTVYHAPDRRVRLDADDRRERMIEAAQLIFADRAYDSVSTEELARAAGTTRTNLNYHFGNKRNLYLEVLRRFAALPSHLPPGRYPERRVRRRCRPDTVHPMARSRRGQPGNLHRPDASATDGRRRDRGSAQG